MSLVNEVGGGLDGLSQLRALMASGRKPGILAALDFEFVEVEAGKAIFAHTRGARLQSDRYGAWRLCRDAARFRRGCAVHSRLTGTRSSVAIGCTRSGA